MQIDIIKKDLSGIRQNKKLFQKWKIWENLSAKWPLYSYPFRPSDANIKNYEGILKKISKKKKVLILGATPELRDIAAKMNLNVAVADFSLSMLKGMLKFAKYAVKYRERWVVADWLSLDKFFKNNDFDVILGDLVLRNIEPGLQNKFLKKISNLLIPGGFFITRIHFIDEGIFKLNSVSIIREVFDKYSNRDNKLLEDLITSRLFDKNTDFKNHNIGSNAFSADIKKYLQDFSRDSKEFKILKNILRKWGGDNAWSQRTHQEINTFLKKYFIIHDLKSTSGYRDSEFYPLIVLVKNLTK